MDLRNALSYPLDMTSFIETPGLPIRHEVSAAILSKSHENSQKSVFLTSIALPDRDVFRNGLYQNIFMLYELIETLGYKTYIFTEKPLADVSGSEVLHKNFRVIDMNEFMAHPFQVYHVVEVAMGLAPQIRTLFKSIGARVTKLYLGNVLNIDIEIPTCIPPMNLSHHIAGDLDEIWTSPHYAPNVEYAGIINTGTDRKIPPARVVPYVWNPRFIRDCPEFVRPLKYSFTIIEPNISFQKCSLVPLMILEALYRRSPSAVESVIVINGDKVCSSPYFDLLIKPRLQLVKDGRVEFKHRMSVVDIMQTWPSNIVIGNQILNEYNYIMMEHLYKGFPYVHNCASLADYGYYYEGCDIESGVAAVERALKTHNVRGEAVRAEAEQLAWKFSPHNPEILAVWAKLLDHS